MEQNRQELSKRVQNEKTKSDKLYKRFRYSNIIASILIAIAGVLTTFASQVDGETKFWAGTTALAIYGIVTAVVTILKESFGFVTKSDHWKIRERVCERIIHLLKYATEEKFPSVKAAELLLQAKDDPAKVLADLPTL